MAEHNEVANQATTRIVLQHHDRLVRDALAHWLVALPGFVLAGSTGSRPGLVRLCTLSRPDIVLLDVSSAQQDTMATIAGLTAVGNHSNGSNPGARSTNGNGSRPGPPCLIGLHGSLDVGAVARLHRAGVRRLVSYRSGLAGLRAALADAGPAHHRTPSARAGLTGREQEVLALICAGRSAAQIAVTLEISPHTVVNHTRHIFAKLDVRSRTQAAAEVARLGLLGDVAILPSNADGMPGGAPVGEDVRRIVASAVARGADAVLTGEGLVEQLPAVLSMVRAGYMVAPAGPVRALLSSAYPRLAPLELTRRELDILGSIRQGHSVRQTAQALGIAVKTVQSVQRQLFLRLGARNRTEALALADGLGLVDS